LGGYADKIVLGGVLIATLAFFPGGLIGLWRRLSARH
jgi:ABC-type branched-subunit amino acid transport system permease subunit